MAHITVSYSFGNMIAKKDRKEERREEDMVPRDGTEDQMGDIGQ